MIKFQRRLESGWNIECTGFASTASWKLARYTGQARIWIDPDTLRHTDCDFDSTTKTQYANSRGCSNGSTQL